MHTRIAVKYLLLLLISCCLTLNSGFAQFYEDFSDGDLSNGVLWSGNTGNYKVNSSKQLQLNASGAGSSYISAALADGELTEWNFWIKMSFSPSDNNQSIIYLVSDKPDLSVSLNGYYLKLGETGSGDAIRLFRQEQSEHLLIASGFEGFLCDAFEIRIKVTRDDGSWNIYADSTGGNSWQLQGAGIDEYWQQYSYFGILCRYTASNSTKFKFDELYAGPPVIDTQPPVITCALVTDPNSIDLQFNEPINGQSAAVCSNYFVDNDFGSPVAAGINQSDLSIVRLQFLDSFIESKDYKIKVRNLTDVAGNKMHDCEVTVAYNPVHQYDILINEIMSDPSPMVELPDCEYVELYNRTGHEFKLNGFSLSTGDNVEKLPSFSIPANGYHIITGVGHDTLMTSYGTVTAIPGFSLLNSGEPVGIWDNNMALIHQVNYNPAWLDDNFKEDGGWSLELIDPLNPCGDKDNWEASSDPSGGTPGEKNSAYRPNPDMSMPTIEWIAVEDSVTIKLVFNETMDSIALKNPLNYYATGGLGYPQKTELIPPVYNSVRLIFSAPIAKDVTYNLEISEKLCDCAGNKAGVSGLTSFALPVVPDSNDLIINEILFDPYTSKAEFVEIFNRSNNVLSLKNILFGVYEDISGELLSSTRISDEHRIIFPGEYLVLTSEPHLITSQYYSPPEARFVKCNGFPSLPNSGATIVISTSGMELLDRVKYDEDLHFSLLNSTKGISLERVNYNAPSADPANWHSASQTCGFATPGYRNSQFMNFTDASAQISIVPQSISPDNDGFEDQMLFNFTFTKPGTLVTLKIFDSDGQEVKTIASSHLAGEKVTLIWDGTGENKQRIPSGIYVVFCQLLNLDGKVTSSKQAVVVTGR